LSSNPEAKTIYENLLIDPRAGDIEDDASSTKQRKLSAIAGSILAEISIAKFVVAWGLLIVVPSVVLGIGPLVFSVWLSRVTDKFATMSGLGSIVLLSILSVVGIYGLRPLMRLVERNFWALQAIAVQPIYGLFREGLSQVAESRLPINSNTIDRARRRSLTALAAGLLSSALGLGLFVLAWPHTVWLGTFADLANPVRLAMPGLANAIAIGGVYLAAASLLWAIADATMHQPHELKIAGAALHRGKTSRIAHLSDLHIVGEPYGFRIESGRAGPRGNERIVRLFDCLSEEHGRRPVDLVLITGDMTDAGRSAEWIEFLGSLARHPDIRVRTLILPGNHDLNVVDRSNPARLELPASPLKQLRQMRVLSAMVAVQGDRVRVFDRVSQRLGETLREVVAPYEGRIRDLADRKPLMRSTELAQLWAGCFPQILPPGTDGGPGVVLLNSNAEANFSFTNALGLLPAEDLRILRSVVDQFPGSGWIVGLHHHLMEYPMPAASLSERIGTALINGSWVVRQLEPIGERLLVMHGHRHIDWIGHAGPLKIVSAPSPVMDARDCDDTGFYIHEVAVTNKGSVDLVGHETVRVTGENPVS
jgi:hypothetical protein